MKINSIRKQANRSIPATQCEKCGSTERLQRHHEDYREPMNVVILCQTCHKNHHVKNGTWGSGAKKLKVCVICGTAFTLGHPSLKTCSKECLTVLGRNNANKRWHPCA